MQTLYFHPVVSSFYILLFFPRLISAVAYSMLPYFHTWCGLSANLGCRSEMCCMRLAENTGRKKSLNICNLRPIAQLCQSISSQLRHVSTMRKNFLNSNISSTPPHNMANFWTTNGWDQFGCLGHPSKFQQVSLLGRVTARHSSSRHQPNCGVTALNRGHHLYSARRPSRWALTHIPAICALTMIHRRQKGHLACSIDPGSIDCQRFSPGTGGGPRGNRWLSFTWKNSR